MPTQSAYSLTVDHKIPYPVITWMSKLSCFCLNGLADMEPETRSKAIIAVSFLIAVAVAMQFEEPVAVGIYVWLASYVLLYALYYASFVFSWIAFQGQNGTGLRLVPRLWALIVRGMPLVRRAVVWAVRSIQNAIERRRYERERPERERREAEAAQAEAVRREQEAEAARVREEEERQRQKAADEEEHQRRVRREAEVTEARARSEMAVRLEMQEEVNRQAREHEERMLEIERERQGLAEQRAKGHQTLVGTLSDLVEKSKD